MDPINVCMECGHEWEEKNALYCPHCHSGDFDTQTEKDIALEELEDIKKAFNRFVKLSEEFIKNMKEN